MTKRIVGLFLALCLVVGLLPMIALAEEGETPPPATLAIASGTNDAPAEWTPELSEGMAPAYAKTVNGLIVTDGASETDYNLKVEWAIGGDPTLTLKNATINNDNVYPAKKDTIALGGTEDFVILLEGANYINAYLSATSYKMSAYRTPFGIAAYNTGDLTVRGTSKATDALYIDNTLGHGVDSRYGALTIENCTFDIKLHGITNSYPQHGILMQYHAEGYEDKTNLTVRNCNFGIKIGYFGEEGEFIFDDYAALGKSNCYSSFGILMTKTDGKYSAANTGDILFQNSEVYFNRKNSSGNNAAYVQYSPNGSCTFDRCDMETCYSWRVVFAYIPTVVNCASAQYTQQSDSAVVAYDPAVAGTAVNIRSLQLTHACISSASDDFDCTTASACDVCGKAMGTAQTAHTPAADDGDCTTAVMCANAGCKKVVTEAKAAHTPAADDGDCTTAVKCTVCGKETTPAQAAHTGGTATCTKKAECATCGKEYGELASHTGGTATCTAKAKCTVCGAEYGEMIPHTPAKRESCDVAANCTVCGQEALKAGQHTGGTATCTAKAKCTECGKEYGELAAHKGGTATCKDKAKCTECGAEYGELLTTHTGGTATCKDKAKCTVCGKEYGELSKTHTPAADDGDCTTAIKCTVCGAETTAAVKEHKFANDKDTSCDNAGCKHTRTISTNPNTGDISILLTAAVALTSAVGFAGVTVLRKKEY